MIAARICLLNKQTVREAEKQAGVSNAYVAKAAVVLEYTPELADSVIAGATALMESLC
jgi:hypothetical protein